MQVNPVISAEAASDLRQDIFKIGASLCVFLPLCSIIAAVFLSIYSSVTGMEDATAVESFLKSGLYNVYSLVLSIVPIAVCILILLLSFKRKMSLIALKPTASPKKFLCITALGLSAIALGSNAASITVLIMQFFNLRVSEVTAPEGVVSTIVFFFVYVIAAPVTEELLFRGIILERLRRYGDFFAIIVSAMLFSLMHAAFQSFAMAFVCGVVFALIAIYSGSPLSSMIVHAINNALSVISIIIAHYLSQELATGFLTLSVHALAGLSLLAFFTLRRKSKETFILPFSGEVVARKRKISIVLFSFPMIVFIVMCISNAITSAF